MDIRNQWKRFKEVQHKRRRSYVKKLREEIDAELASLEPVLKQCDNEIARLKAKIETTGLANEVMQNVLTQCVRITARIEVLEDENRTLRREREAQEERLLAARRLEQKLVDRQLAIEEAVSKINTCTQTTT